MTDMPPTLGDVTFIDNFRPGLRAGNYWITVTHSLPADVNSGAAPKAVQEFVVRAPQFVLDPTEIVSQHPPDTASGRFGEQLAHIVFREAALPWERPMDSDPATPWLALLVLTEDELLDGEGTPTRIRNTTIARFLAPEPGVLKPRVEPADDVDTSGPVNTIRLSVDTFVALAPRLDELPYLAHCRQAAICDKAALQLDPSGLSAVVVANRFPATRARGQTAVKNLVHLVSLEGVQDWLTASPDFGGATSIALVSLASWTFQCLPDHDADFRGLAGALVESERENGAYQPGRLWLRLGLKAAGANAAAVTEAQRRLDHGYVPLGYHTRTGEDGFAWYRGPLVPVLPAPLASTRPPFTSADSAIIYQASHGMFDMSLAAAWEAGRALALSDKTFGQRVLDFRRRAHRITDELLERLQRQYFFSQQQIDSLSTDTSVQDEFLSILDADLLKAVGDTAHARVTQPRPPPRLAAAPGTSDPKAVVQEFLAEARVQRRIVQLVADDLDGLAAWLARLLLLYPVPFNLLVPDERMLPPESLRFFYLDRNWTRALLDGALSLGLESSRQTFFHTVTHGLLHEAALEAARALRQTLTGVEPPGQDSEDGPVSGFLLRSTLVSGWPNLVVRGHASARGDDTLKLLRLEHLSPSVLLCLFWGVPTHVELSEPQEGFRFGVDDDGNAVLRNLNAGPDLGEQLGQPLHVYDPTGTSQGFARAPGSRVLNLAPGVPTGLVQTLRQALANARGMPEGPLRPAQLALQLVKSPEALVFTSQPG